MFSSYRSYATSKESSHQSFFEFTYRSIFKLWRKILIACKCHPLIPGHESTCTVLASSIYRSLGVLHQVKIFSNKNFYHQYRSFYIINIYELQSQYPSDSTILSSGVLILFHLLELAKKSGILLSPESLSEVETPNCFPWSGARI